MERLSSPYVYDALRLQLGGNSAAAIAVAIRNIEDRTDSFRFYRIYLNMVIPLSQPENDGREG